MSKLKLTKQEKIKADIKDISLECLELKTTIKDINWTLEKINRADGVSKEMAEPYKNILSININSFSQAPTYTNLESFKDSLSKLLKRTLNEFSKSFTKLVNELKTLLKLKKPKIQFKFTNSKLTDEILEEDMDDYSNSFSLFSESVLFSPTTIIKEVYENESLVYNELIKELLNSLDLLNNEFKDPLTNSMIKPTIHSVNVIDEKILNQNKLIREGFSEASTLSKGMGLKTLGGSLIEHITSLKATAPEYPFNLESLLDFLNKKGVDGTAFGLTKTPFRHLDDDVHSNMNKAIWLMETFQESITDAANEDLELNDVQELSDSVIKILDRLTDSIYFLIDCSDFRIQVSDEIVKYLKIVKKNTK